MFGSFAAVPRGATYDSFRDLGPSALDDSSVGLGVVCSLGPQSSTFGSGFGGDGSLDSGTPMLHKPGATPNCSSGGYARNGFQLNCDHLDPLDGFGAPISAGLLSDGSESILKSDLFGPNGFSSVPSAASRSSKESSVDDLHCLDTDINLDGPPSSNLPGSKTNSSSPSTSALELELQVPGPMAQSFVQPRGERLGAASRSHNLKLVKEFKRRVKEFYEQRLPECAELLEWHRTRVSETMSVLWTCSQYEVKRAEDKIDNTLYLLYEYLDWERGAPGDWGLRLKQWNTNPGMLQDALPSNTTMFPRFLRRKPSSSSNSASLSRSPSPSPSFPSTSLGNAARWPTPALASTVEQPIYLAGNGVPPQYPQQAPKNFPGQELLNPFTPDPIIPLNRHEAEAQELIRTIVASASIFGLAVVYPEQMPFASLPPLASSGSASRSFTQLEAPSPQWGVSSSGVGGSANDSRGEQRLSTEW